MTGQEARRLTALLGAAAREGLVPDGTVRVHVHGTRVECKVDGRVRPVVLHWTRDEQQHWTRLAAQLLKR